MILLELDFSDYIIIREGFRFNNFELCNRM